MHREQLQKFAQYLISELPQQILPTAQRLLDELLSSQQTAINTVRGAPDPTAGASIQEQTSWCLDESQLHENIRKILIKLCVPSPIVFSDVNYLTSTAPPAAAEWSSLLRPLRGREPEGMWNLLSIVREMLRRNDRNAIPLLEILTEEVLACDQIILWWFNTKVSLHAGTNHGNRGNIHSNTHTSQHACSSLCDEIVILWRLVALNPSLSPRDAKTFYNQLHDWHIKTLERVLKMRNSNNGNNSSIAVKRSDVEIFPGFKPAMEGCLMDWSDYPIPGVTYNGSVNRWQFPTVHAHTSSNGSSSNNNNDSTSNNTSKTSLCISRKGRSVDITHSSSSPIHMNDKKLSTTPISVPTTSCTLSVIHSTLSASTSKNDSNRSSLSSEGFCETENDQLEEPNVSSINSNPNQAKSTIIRQISNDSNELVGDGSDSCTESFIYLNDELSNKISSKNVSPKENDQTKQDQDNNQNGKVADEFELYLYDTKEKFETKPNSIQNKAENGASPKRQNENNNNNQMTESDLEKLLVIVKRIEDSMEILFARAEALHAHGRTLEACHLAVKLAEELLANPPNLMVEIPNPPARGKRGRRFNPHSHQISLLASATLSKAAFLCSVLGENPDYHYLAFRVGLFGLEMARPPASTKALEVKLANQEQDLVVLLKRIPLTMKKLQVLRERAEQLREGRLRSRGEALLPLMLASYIFDALVLSPRSTRYSSPNSIDDEKLGFEAAVAALGLKANVSEAEHPLLCEGTRRQRGELAITLLIHYKDDQEKLAKIMDKLLDKEVHQMFKNVETFPNKSESGTPAPAINTNGDSKSETPNKVVKNNMTVQEENESSINNTGKSDDSIQKFARKQNQTDLERSDGGSSPCWEEDYKAWEARFRCTNFKTNKKHSVGMASIDSSAPETTSSDNSPTVVRRSLWVRPNGPGSDSGSSGESSDSFSSSSSGDKAKAKIREAQNSQIANITNRLACCTTSDSVIAPNISRTPYNPLNGVVGVSNNISITINTAKQIRFKGKRVYPSIPNQPSEASAHFMFELAKTVLIKSGGSSTTAVLFTQPSATQNCRGPHRALHMCAFQIGLYALGLHNAVSPNWLSRTYSSHVSWITGQAMEIGSPAINFLIDTWEGHLTPPEVASLADRASRGRDPAMVKAAAELALSCLPHASALNPNEIQRALIQCKEQSNDMLERACLAVESAAKGGGVYPEVLFEVARKWFDLYEESIQERTRRNGNAASRIQGNRVNVNDNVNNGNNLIGEFQVNQANSNSLSSSNSICIPEQPSIILPIQAERQNQFDGLIGPPPPQAITVNSATSNTSGLPLQVLPQISCPPTNHYALPPNAPYPFNFYQNLPPFPQPLYIPAAPTTCPFPFPFYPANPVTTTSNLPQLRSVMTPVLFQGQTIMPNTAQNSQINHMSRPIVTIATSYPQQALHVNGTVNAQMPNQSLQQLNQRQINYLMSSYRVGMLAMETLARRVHDDRPQTKYARNPSYGEDVKWLLKIAKMLGMN